MPLHAVAARRRERAVSLRIDLLPDAAPYGGTSVEAVRPPLHATDGLRGLQPLCDWSVCCGLERCGVYRRSTTADFVQQTNIRTAQGMVCRGEQEREGRQLRAGPHSLHEMQHARYMVPQSTAMRQQRRSETAEVRWSARGGGF